LDLQKCFPFLLLMYTPHSASMHQLSLELCACSLTVSGPWCCAACVAPSREKNLEKAQKEAKVKARKEAARKDELNDTVTDQQLQQLEADFFSATGLTGATGLTCCMAGRSGAAAEGSGEVEGEGAADGEASVPATPHGLKRQQTSSQPATARG
jgi:hypothetical protein